MGQQWLIYSFAARGTVILAEYTEFTGNFTSIAAQCLQKLPATNNKFTYNCDGHTFNYLVDNGFTYCVVAIEAAGRQVPIAFLERIKEDFTKRYGGGKATTAVANSLNKEYGPKLKEQMQYCVDHPEEISELAKVEAQVSEVKGVMMENIEKVLRGLPSTMANHGDGDRRPLDVDQRVEDLYVVMTEQQRITQEHSRTLTEIRDMLAALNVNANNRQVEGRRAEGVAGGQPVNRNASRRPGYYHPDSEDESEEEEEEYAPRRGGEKIELLVDKTENLHSQAQDFRQQGTKMRRKMWFHLVIVLGTIIALILIIVLSNCHGFNCSK